MKRDRLELLVQVATWYYEDNLTQGEIAKRINLSRSMVSRLLQESRDQGLIEIQIKYPLRTDTDMEAWLKHTFGLAHARVLADPPPEHEVMLKRLGELSARFLQEQLHDDMYIGIGWGTALYETTRCMPTLPLQDVQVIQIIGAVGHGDPLVDGLELARWMAQKLDAPYRLVHAPALVESVEIAQAFRQERTIAETLALIPKVEVALIGVGTIEPRLSSLRRAGLLSDAELDSLRQAGAVGDVLAYQLDAFGRLLDVPLNQRIIATDLETLRCIPLVVAVAGNVLKAQAILAALRGGYINALVTDARTIAEVQNLYEKI